MTAVWITIGGLTVATAAIKAAGPIALGGRELPAMAYRLIALLAPTLLAALVVVETVTHDRELVIDARLPGVVAAAAATLADRSLVEVVTVAALVTALVRAVG